MVISIGRYIYLKIWGIDFFIVIVLLKLFLSYFTYFIMLVIFDRFLGNNSLLKNILYDKRLWKFILLIRCGFFFLSEVKSFNNWLCIEKIKYCYGN